jgi:hypothetical protein
LKKQAVKRPAKRAVKKTAAGTAAIRTAVVRKTVSKKTASKKTVTKKAVVSKTGPRSTARTAKPRSEADSYLAVVQQHWDSVMEQYRQFKESSPVLVLDVLSGRVRAYGADFLNTLSARTREQAKSQYRRTVDEGTLMVFVSDLARQVLRSYIFSFEGISQGPQASGVNGAAGLSKGEEFYRTWAALHEIYSRHTRQHYRKIPESGQLCLMWAGEPDILVTTEPIYDMQDAFDIHISAMEACELFDMDLDEAAETIMRMRRQQVTGGSGRG